MVVCGVVEYFTAYYLKTVYDRRWWDYAGYFLNLHGRICAEGLLVFGLGGMAVVYGVAPLFDNLLHKGQAQRADRAVRRADRACSASIRRILIFIPTRARASRTRWLGKDGRRSDSP